MEDKQIKFGIEIPTSLKKAVNVKRAELGIKLKEAYVLAFSQWVSEDSGLASELALAYREGTPTVKAHIKNALDEWREHQERLRRQSEKAEIEPEKAATPIKRGAYKKAV